MSKELDLYKFNVKSEMVGGGEKNNKIELNFDNAVKKYRKRCIELKQENDLLKKENEKLKNEIGKYKKH